VHELARSSIHVERGFGLIRLVVFDLDETLWTMGEGYCALMTPPFERDGDRVRDRSGLALTLRPEARPTLDELTRRGYRLSVASRSRPATARSLLSLLGLLGLFICPCFEWQDKDLSLSRILEDCRRQHSLTFLPEEVLFVDDWPSNVRDATRLGVRGLIYGQDIETLSDIFSHLDREGASHAV
jgi:magnesium-dependent phosphatase-1